MKKIELKKLIKEILVSLNESEYSSAAEIRDRDEEITDWRMIENIPEYELKKMIQNPKRYDLSSSEVKNLKIALYKRSR